MSTGRVFSASDAEQQAGDAAANYLARATRIVAESVFMEIDYRHFPAEFADRFASLIGAVVEAQAREYQSWVLFDCLGALDRTLQNRLDDLAACLDKLADRLNPQAVDAGRP